MTLYWKDFKGRNWPVCSCLKEWLTAYQNELLRVGELKKGLDLFQTIGGAAASAGYHLKGGNVDTGQTSRRAIRIARNMGGAAFGRGPADGMTVHCHIALKGCPHMTAGPRWQVVELEAGRNGLVNRKRDRGPRDGIKWPLRSFTQGIAWAKAQGKAGVPAKPLRVGTLNFPDATKITTATEADRIAVAVAQIHAAELDIVAVQEGVGRITRVVDGKLTAYPSSLMRRLEVALGDDEWDVITPTTDANENYFFVRKGIARTQHPDKIIVGKLGGKSLPGRHVSLVTFTTSLGKVTVGNTQLVNDNRPGAQVQAQLAGAALADITSGRRILVGDLNDNAPFAGLTKNGLTDSAQLAKATSNRAYATYTNQKKTVPSKDPEWIVDHIWVSKEFTVNGLTNVLELDSAGKFVEPRVSDHNLLIASLS